MVSIEAPSEGELLIDGEPSGHRVPNEAVPIPSGRRLLQVRFDDGSLSRPRQTRIRAGRSWRLRLVRAAPIPGESAVGRPTPEPDVLEPAYQPIEGLDDAIQISVGRDHGCALRRGGQLACWGDHRIGPRDERRRPGTEDPFNATAVAEVEDAIQVSAGDDLTCFVREGGRLACWGRLPRPDRVWLTVVDPQAVTRVSGVRQVSAGGSCICAVLEDGRVSCWGDNVEGALGSGPGDRTATPRIVPSLSGVADVLAGSDTTCARGRDGQVWCWGDNRYGLLATGSTLDRPEPVAVSGLDGAESLALGSRTACVLEAGRPLCWGDNSRDHLIADGDWALLSPTPVTAIEGAQQLALGEDFSCALMADGTVSCWGINDRDALGYRRPRGPSEAQPPRTIPGLTGVTQIAAGPRNACALGDDGSVVCWGRWR